MVQHATEAFELATELDNPNSDALATDLRELLVWMNVNPNDDTTSVPAVVFD